ncbi:MAG: hypothetical protein QM537_08525, partial [Candidatus Symbiobacter sp.]|nr:hypothetical protein [Candidatus Symbiobacter sp.]
CERAASPAKQSSNILKLLDFSGLLRGIIAGLLRAMRSQHRIVTQLLRNWTILMARKCDFFWDLF